DQPAIARVIIGDGDDAVGSGMNRSAVIRGDVDSGVESTLTTEGVETFPESIRNVAHYRPHRWRIGGIGKAQSRNKAQAAAADSDGRRIPLQESVLLDGKVESILRRNGIVGQIKGSGMVAKHTVGHGHFGGKRLQ